jgi:RNA polymerase sigma-70 factor (ECF subfamily)
LRDGRKTISAPERDAGGEFAVPSGTFFPRRSRFGIWYIGGMSWDGVHALVQQAKQGDREALARLYEMAQPHLLRLAQKLLGPGWPDKSVSDLTQETWPRACENIHKFRGAAGDDDTAAMLRAWLARIMKNVWRNDVRFGNAACRKAAANSVPLEPGCDLPGQPCADDLTPSENFRCSEQHSLIQQALHKLADPGDGEIVRLRFFEGLSFPEIGKRLGCDESTVRYHLQRILEFLGRELKGLR